MAWVRLAGAHELRWHAVYRGPEADLLRRLGRLFQALNARHFGGALPTVPVRLSGRLRTRLGQIVIERRSGLPLAIELNRRHATADDPLELEETLLHEMVHLWQCANGYRVDHGARFRAEAHRVGVTPAARRRVRDRGGATRSA